ncbi:MAG TPA: DegV family protein [candidate division Zixibacteria bacterium]|nr:DegV family protein [candidate division Zixibacteria bacterium]
MRNVAIVTDGSSDLPKELVEEYDINIAPFKVVFGDDVYHMMGNYGDITPDEFYQLYATRKDFPTTSVPSPQAFKDAIENALKNANSVIGIFISSELSGTYQSAKRLAESMFSDKEVIIIDSKVAASTLGALVIEAAKMAKNNATKDEILKRINEIIPYGKLVSVQDNIDAVYRSGRVGWAKKFLVSTFKIKPILLFEEGKLVPGGTIRGREEADKALRNAAKYIPTNCKTDLIFVWHVRSLEFANELKSIMEENNPDNKEIRVIEAGPVVGTHVGPGAIAFMYYGDYNPDWILKIEN